ncbi:hypothetical protein RHSIM_Rhsim01G0200400 [Rhododendron simsii]|uniref:Uncharacterized protein n=1 Tax=Rhododendron simsii TaxID=118357 RepID=A0A834HDF9_RHOSS|nr:hypothetical protein RHSIM_Rhsim01G0200400 [Rhododendron simsii]
MPMGCRIDFFITILFEAIANSANLTPQLATPCKASPCGSRPLFQQTTRSTLQYPTSSLDNASVASSTTSTGNHKHSRESNPPASWPTSDQDELNHRVADFLRDLEAAPCNAGQTELSVHLTILQEITLPAEEFEEWTSWYYDQAAVQSESFVEEYNRAIMEQRRHTEIEEGLDQVSSGWLDTTGLEEVCYEKGDAKEQCSICLEEFVAVYINDALGTSKYRCLGARLELRNTIFLEEQLDSEYAILLEEFVIGTSVPSLVLSTRRKVHFKMVEDEEQCLPLVNCACSWCPPLALRN